MSSKPKWLNKGFRMQVGAFIFKDDGGGMEPHLQRSNGVRLVLNSADAQRAEDILQALEKTA